MKNISIGYHRGPRDVNLAYNKIVSSMFMMNERHGMKSFVFTGCDKKVGNTTICINLAAELANTGKKTLLVDCDYLKPAEEKRLYQFVDAGLAELFGGNAAIGDVIYQTDVPKLHYISSGKNDINPTVMLWSEQFNQFMDFITKEYDFVIFDTAPVLLAPEVCVIAFRASGTVLTVQCGKTLKSQIYAAKKEIENMSRNFLGVIVNKTPVSEYKIYQKNHGFSMIIRGPEKRNGDGNGNDNE